MKMIAVALIAVAQGAVLRQSLLDDTDASFANYMAKYGKSYTTKEEYEMRRSLYASRLQAISEINSRNEATYTVAINKFSDLTPEEFRARYLGDLGTPDNSIEGDPSSITDTAIEPIDWRTKGIVGPVKNQRSCGSCWAFSTVGPIEEHYAIKYGVQQVFAEQQLVDCSFPYGNLGCDGGLYANGYAYVKQYGLQFNSSYPYTNQTGTCQYDSSQVAVRIRGTISAVRSAEGLKAALMNGPASISLHAGYESFMHYSGGIYANMSCPTNVDHAVQSVGWGTNNGQDYFIVRNSWGADWGEQGYIRIAKVNTDLGVCGMLYRVPMQPIIA